MSFEKDNFVVIKNALDKNTANFLYDYFLLKRQVVQTYQKSRYISPYTNEYGVWNDGQVENTYSVYGDIAFEVLLEQIKPKMEEATNMKLISNYTYGRLYKKGDILKRHKDRFSCEVSTTLNLGGDPWPIFVEPSEEVDKKGIQIDLDPGDMLAYRGNICEHWREEFTGDVCGQVFLHYNNKETPDAEKNKFDRRPHLGLPDWFRYDGI
jgi:hypothetical protein